MFLFCLWDRYLASCGTVGTVLTCTACQNATCRPCFWWRKTHSALNIIESQWQHGYLFVKNVNKIPFFHFLSVHSLLFVKQYWSMKKWIFLGTLRSELWLLIFFFLSFAWRTYVRYCTTTTFYSCSNKSPEVWELARERKKGKNKYA